MLHPAYYLKALLAALGAFLASVANALPEGVSGQEWLTAAAAAAAAGGVVFVARNADKPTAERPGDGQEPVMDDPVDYQPEGHPDA